MPRAQVHAPATGNPVRPATPEPEVAALRQDLRKAAERTTDLERRCDKFMAEARQARQALAAAEARLADLTRGEAGELADEVERLRGRVVDHEQLARRLDEAERGRQEAEARLRTLGHDGFSSRDRKDSWAALVMLEDWISAGEPGSD